MDNRIFEMDQRLQKLDEALEAIRMETRAAHEAAAKLRAARLQLNEMKALLDGELRRIVAEAVAKYIREELQ